MAQNLPFALFILDGLGNNPNPVGNAVAAAKKPTLDRLFAECPKTELVTWGPRVGLPEGQMGNSEVGHLNIGGGRIVKQELTRIDETMRAGQLSQIPAFQSLVTHCLEDDSRALHIVGLASTGGVHSSLPHLCALIRAALAAKVKHVFIHAITDGRDRPVDASLQDIGQLQHFLLEDCREYREHSEFGVASLIGRYFAMDRDKRWNRTERALRLYLDGEGTAFLDPIESLQSQLSAGKTDEFSEPQFVADGIFSREPIIRNEDSVLFFNFRADRMRQLVSVLARKDSAADELVQSLRIPDEIRIATLTEYDGTFDLPVLFPPSIVKNHLGEIISQAGLSQIRAAETEKYPHVTYFFNGTVEEPYPGEERIMVPSPREVATYDRKPEMSARELTAALLERLKGNRPDVSIVNFANCDMVGHTGVFEAAVKAVEVVDECLGKLLEEIEKAGGTAIVTADHGNADQMIDYDTGAPHTFHTKHPVPLYLVGKNLQRLHLRKGGALCDIAPTICQILGIAQPSDMTGVSLISS